MAVAEFDWGESSSEIKEWAIEVDDQLEQMLKVNASDSDDHLTKWFGSHLLHGIIGEVAW